MAEGMNPKAMRGLKAWAKGKPTKDIAATLEDKDVDDPKALAVWIRKKAIGAATFKQHQQAARAKK